MGVPTAAELSLKSGDPVDALDRLQEQVRANPGDASLRIFLFQLLCVLGKWERALNQLKVASDLDPAAIAMAQMYGEAVRCEAIRAEVFAGRKSPVVFGQPEQWLALLIESLLLGGQGEPGKAEQLRLRAFEEAPGSSGTIDGRAFEWIADADSRLGPVLEAIVNGRYYWIPFSRFARIDIEAPTDLRDLVWLPAHFLFENGGETVALIPSRYPGSHDTTDGQVALGRKTIWQEVGPDRHYGLGQRVIVTDSEEVPLLQVRTIALNASPDAEAGGAAAHG